MAQASPRLGPTAPPRAPWEVALVLVLLGAAIAVILVAVVVEVIAAPFPDPGRVPSPRPAGY